MPFYLRFHLGPVGYSARLTGNNRRRSATRPSNQIGPGVILVWIFLLGLLIYAIFRWWYISLPIIAVFGALMIWWGVAARRSAATPPDQNLELKTFGPPRYTVTATKPGEATFRESGLPGPRAETLEKAKKKEGWATQIRLDPQGPPAPPAPAAQGPPTAVASPASSDRRSQPTALIVVQEPKPLNWRDHVTLRDARDGQAYYELKASSSEMAEQIRALMESDGWRVTIERFTGH